MDLLGQGLSAITPSQEGYDNFAMRLQRAGAIANNQIPFYMREQQQQMEMANHQDALASRRQQLAQHLEGIKEQKRGHDLQLLEKALASPRAAALLEQLGQDPNYSMAPQAAMLHKGLKDADYGSFQAYMGFIPEDVQKRFMDGKLPQHEMTAWLDEARTEAKESAKVNAKNAIITRAMNKSHDARTPYEQQLVEEHQAKLEVEQMKPKKAQAEISEKESQARMQDAHAKLYDYQRETGGNSVQDMGNDREAAAQRLFKKRYVQLDQRQMKQADDAAAAFMGQAQGFKSTAVQQAQLAVPDKLSDTAREKTATDLSTLDLVDSMAKNYNREWVGPARGRGGAVMEKYSGMPGVPHIGEDEARFRSDITTLKNGVIKAITGAQMSEPEAERIMGQIPDANNPPEVFEARMKSTRANLKRMAERRREVLDKTGASTTDLPGVPKGEKKAKQEEYIETRTTKDGRKLGKTKDGRIVEIK
ncbi:MAG: hypothetical protein ABL983_01730 [Nitrospira sp.]